MSCQKKNFTDLEKWSFLPWILRSETNCSHFVGIFSIHNQTRQAHRSQFRRRIRINPRSNRWMVFLTSKFHAVNRAFLQLLLLTTLATGLIHKARKHRAGPEWAIICCTKMWSSSSRRILLLNRTMKFACAKAFDSWKSRRKASSKTMAWTLTTKRSSWNFCRMQISFKCKILDAISYQSLI